MASLLCLALIVHNAEALSLAPRGAESIVRAVSPSGDSGANPVFSLDRCRTSADAAFETWCDRGGIIAPSVGLRTTPVSVGGRGLFALADLRCNDTVARIPARCVLTRATARHAFPQLTRSLEASGSEVGWAAELTALALHASGERWERQWDEPARPWADTTAEWIRSWRGGGGRPRPVDAVGDTEIAVIAAAACAAPNTVRVALRERHALYARRRAALLALGTDDAAGLAALLDEPAVAALYALVLSRAVALPKLTLESQLARPAGSWGDGAVGVVPLHDMLNHAPRSRATVALRGCPVGGDDLVLTATADVAAGGELLTAYYGDEGEGDERQRVRTLLHYDIPPSPQWEVDRRPP